MAPASQGVGVYLSEYWYADSSGAQYRMLINNVLQTGRIEPAAAEAATALRLAPDDLSANETMGQVLFRQADYLGALDRFTRAVALGAKKAPVAAALK